MCGRRRRGRGPLAAVLSPAARRAPAAAATAAQIENFCEKLESICYGIFCEISLIFFKNPLQELRICMSWAFCMESTAHRFIFRYVCSMYDQRLQLELIPSVAKINEKIKIEMKNENEK